MRGGATCSWPCTRAHPSPASSSSPSVRSTGSCTAHPAPRSAPTTPTTSCSGRLCAGPGNTASTTTTWSASQTRKPQRGRSLLRRLQVQDRLRRQRNRLRRLPGPTDQDRPRKGLVRVRAGILPPLLQAPEQRILLARYGPSPGAWRRAVACYLWCCCYGRAEVVSVDLRHGHLVRGN